MVNGHLININFEEVQTLKANDLLFEIDSRNFENQLKTAEAGLLRDKSQLENAEKEEQKYRNLLAQKAVSQEQYLQMLTNMNVLKASVSADEAVIENARLQVEYTKILAPIDGRAGESIFHTGDLIEANSASPMVVINKISPMYVSFSVPEQHLSVLRSAKDADDLLVTIKTSSGEEVKGGKVVFIDNTIDITNGTIKLKALFPNTDEILWPGQFVKVYINVNNKKDALVVPTKAVQMNQEGAYVFVIGQDNKAEIRKVTVDFANDNCTVISEGLKKEEQVVINGQLRVSSGAEVIPTYIQEGS